MNLVKTWSIYLSNKQICKSSSSHVHTTIFKIQLELFISSNVPKWATTIPSFLQPEIKKKERKNRCKRSIKARNSRIVDATTRRFYVAVGAVCLSHSEITKVRENEEKKRGGRKNRNLKQQQKSTKERKSSTHTHTHAHTHTHTHTHMHTEKGGGNVRKKSVERNGKLTKKGSCCFDLPNKKYQNVWRITDAFSSF